MTPTVIFHSWHTSNTPTENGRIYVLSFMTGAANAGGIIASLVFRKQNAPRYIPFLATAAAFEATGIVLIMGKMYPWPISKMVRMMFSGDGLCNLLEIVLIEK
jgi:hypothetical protein